MSKITFSQNDIAEIYRIAKAAQLISVTAYETLDDLKSRLKVNNIFAAKRNNSHIFNASMLKRMLSDAGFPDAKSLVWDPRPGTGKISLAEAMKNAVLSSGSSGQTPSAQMPKPQKATIEVPSDFGKRSTVKSMQDKVRERFSRQLAVPAPSITIEKVKSEFDPLRCRTGAPNTYSMTELQGLSDKYMIPTNEDDSKEEICHKLTSHWSKWMAGRLRDFFRSKSCTSRSKSELIKIAQDYAIAEPEELNEAQICEALTRKLFDLIFTTRMNEFNVGDISREVVDLIMEGKFDITSSGISDKQRLAILAASSFINPRLLDFIQVSDVKDPEIKKNMIAEFNLIQQGLSSIDSAVAELNPKEVQQAAEAIAEKIVQEERVKSGEEADNAEREILPLDEKQKEELPPGLNFESVILGGKRSSQDKYFIPSDEVVSGALAEFGVNSLKELMPTLEAENIIRSMHIGRPSRKSGIYLIDGGRVEVPFNEKDVDGIPIVKSSGNIYYIDGMLLSNTSEAKLRNIIKDNLPKSTRKEKIMAAKSFRELVEAGHDGETDAFIPSQSTEEILFAETFQVGSFEEMLPTLEAREKILRMMLGTAVIEGKSRVPNKINLGYGTLIVDFNKKEVDGIPIISSEKMPKYTLHIIDGFVLGDETADELDKIISANRKTPYVAPEEPLIVPEPEPIINVEQEEKVAQSIIIEAEIPMMEEIPVPKLSLYEVISNKINLSIFTSFINAVPDAVKILQGKTKLDIAIPHDDAIREALERTGNTVDSLMQSDSFKGYVLDYVSYNPKIPGLTDVEIQGEGNNGLLRILSSDTKMPLPETPEEEEIEEEPIPLPVAPQIDIQEKVPPSERMIGGANIPAEYEMGEFLKKAAAENRIEKTKTIEPQILVPQEEKETMKKQSIEEQLNDLEGEGIDIKFFINLANSFSSSSIPAEGDVITDQLQSLLDDGKIFFLLVPADEDFEDYFGVKDSTLDVVRNVDSKKVEEFISSHLSILPQGSKTLSSRHTTLDGAVIDEEVLENVVETLNLDGGSKIVVAIGTLPENFEEDEDEDQDDEDDEEDEDEEEVAVAEPPRRPNLFEGDEELLA